MHSHDCMQPLGALSCIIIIIYRNFFFGEPVVFLGSKSFSRLDFYPPGTVEIIIHSGYISL